MSSNRALVLVWSMLLGCAAFSRGEYWDETEGGDTAAADDSAATGNDDAMPDDGGATETGTIDGTDETVGDTGGGSSGGPSGPSFAEEVLPIVRAGCERCHAADGAASNTDYLLNADDNDAYESTLEFCNLDAPKSSRLLAKTAGKGHTGGVIYDDHSAEYATMLAWIEGGAKP